VSPAYPDQFVTTVKKTTGKTSSTEYDTSLATAVLALGAVFIFVGVLLSRVSELTLPGGAGIKLDTEWSADPRTTLPAFLQSAYEAGARTAGWDTSSFESTWCATPAQLDELRTTATAELGRPASRSS
jgi:hypothetical protein